MQNSRSLLINLLACCSLSILNINVVSGSIPVNKSTEISKQIIHGKVINLIDASGYTYAEVDTGESKVWAAAPITALKIGDTVGFSTSMPMKDFHSKSLKRNFTVVYFAPKFITGKGNQAAATSSHNKVNQKPHNQLIKGINKVEGGITIAEIHTGKTKLAGKTIRVRGKVTRFSAEIMGTNWLHIKDSSGLEDLTINTMDRAAVDDVVVIEGKVVLDKDFGYGYFYPLIIQEAKIIGD